MVLRRGRVVADGLLAPREWVERAIRRQIDCAPFIEGAADAGSALPDGTEVRLAPRR
ncbi:hypothetical protein [Kitasatospora cineracea]|uniref:hypothetical protein n=1 Tax=Kitasatospora cineracea TaxID=88074 RepID=UPI00381DB2D2